MRALGRTVASRTRLDNGTEAFLLAISSVWSTTSLAASTAFLDIAVVMTFSWHTHR
jgi:hypothetical protein